MICSQWVLTSIAGLVVSVGSVATDENVATKLTDGEITAEVNQKIAMDDPSVASRILVSTHDGVVTLIGRKLSLGDMLAVTRDANDVQGVVRVDSRLTLM
jgi:osmotically-inducible protein OsmY